MPGKNKVLPVYFLFGNFIVIRFVHILWLIKIYLYHDEGNGGGKERDIKDNAQNAADEYRLGAQRISAPPQIAQGKSHHGREKGEQAPQ